VNSSSLSVLVVGAEGAGRRAFRAVAEMSQAAVAVVTDDGGLSSFAVESGVPVLPGAAVENSTFAEWIELNGVDILLHPDVVRAPRIGSFNLHPGPLPRYAGLMAPSWALFNGESSHAVTLHWMEQGIDTGPVAYESPFPISSSDTGLSVSLRCVKHGIPLIRRLLDAATNSPDSIPLIPQDVKGRRYFGQRPPNGGCVTWASSARELVDFVRACDYLPFRSPWGHPKARLGNRELLILKAGRTFESAHQEPGVVRSVEAETAIVASSDEWIRVDRVQIGGESLRAADVLEPGNQLLDGAISAG
jgi:methionyl-tRNA formyltransferase